jgi:ABC-2 type transport system ATP-binding protein
MSKRQIDERFDQIVEFAGLAEFIDSPVKNYSSGMYVRLGFSVAINVDPDILLVDEVLAVGDENFQRKCSEKFAELKQSGKTIVVVSHALGTMRSLCDELALLEHGNLVRVGPAGQVVDEYLEDVHLDRSPDGEFGTRWGSGEARVDRMELLDSSGRSVTCVRTGDPVTFRFHYETLQPVPKPVFAFDVHTISGTHVAGTNTRDGGQSVDTLVGQGHVDLVVDRLLLVPGTYDVSAVLLDWTCSHVFDERHRFLRFDVERGHPEDSAGVVSLGGVWKGLDARDPDA